TAAGARELASRLASPLTDVVALNARLDTVAYLADEPRLRQTLREELKATPDLARALARLALGRGGPGDLGAVRDAIHSANALAETLSGAGAALGLPQELSTIAQRLGAAPAQVADSLAAALADSLPVNPRDGSFTREGANADLDEHRRLRDGSSWRRALPTGRRSRQRAQLWPSSITNPPSPNWRSNKATCGLGSTARSCSISRTGATPWSSRPCGALTAQASSAMTASSAMKRAAPAPTSSSLPVPTWPASRPSCGRTRLSSCSRSQAPSFRREARISA